MNFIQKYYLLILALLWVGIHNPHVLAQNEAGNQLIRMAIVAKYHEQSRIQRQIEPFRHYLATAVEIPVEIKFYPSLVEVIYGLQRGEVNFARMSSSGYVSAALLCSCVTPLVSAVGSDGSIGFRSALFTLSYANITRLEDLQQKNYLFSGKKSMSGYTIPKAAMLAVGFDAIQLDRQERFETSPILALQKLVAGEIDAFFSWSPVHQNEIPQLGAESIILQMLAPTQTLPQITVPWVSKSIPYNSYVVASSLDEAMQKKVQQALLVLPEKDADIFSKLETQFSGGLRSVNSRDYETIMEVLSFLAKN